MWESAVALVSALVALGTTLDELDFLRKHALMVARLGTEAVTKREPKPGAQRHRNIAQYKVWGPESKI